MSDNLRRYCAIHSALLQLYPSEPTGNLARHLKTLAALVCGIVGSKKAHLPAIASKVADGSKRESRAKRFARFLQNPKVTPEAFFVPYVHALVQSLPPGPLVLVMDGTQVGRGCMALMVSVLYQNRALPLCWQVVKAKKGHFSQEKHQELLVAREASRTAGSSPSMESPRPCRTAFMRDFGFRGGVADMRQAAGRAG